MKVKKFHGPLTTNVELLEFADLYGLNLVVLSKNELPTKIKKKNPLPGNYIINLQDSDKGGGTHWVALVVYPNDSFYFDSMGVFPPTEIIEFVNPFGGGKRRELYISKVQIQNLYGGYCGQYCLDFLFSMKEPSAVGRFYRFLDSWEVR